MMVDLERKIAELESRMKRMEAGRISVDRMQRDIIGNVQIRKRSISMDNIDWPVGTILLWYGSASDVPEGWQICDGTNGTPNMSAAYPKGITSGTPGSTGGSNTHTLSTNELPSHTHSITSGGAHNHKHDAATPWVATGTDYMVAAVWYGYEWWTSTNGSHDHGGATGGTGSGQAHNNEPKYVTFFYIMYVGK